MTDKIWGWSTGGYKRHCWEWQILNCGEVVYLALCQRNLNLWTTEKSPGDERTRCKRCLKLVAQEVR